MIHEDMKKTLRRIPAKRSPDGDPVGDGFFFVDLLSRHRRRHFRRQHCASDRQGANNRSLCLQEVDWPADDLSPEQPARTVPTS